MKTAENIQKSASTAGDIVSCTIHFRQYISKPKDTPEIQDYIKKKYAYGYMHNEPIEVIFKGDIKDLINQAGNNGKTWYGGIFDGVAVDADNVKSIQVFAVDIDVKKPSTTLTIQNSIAKCNNLGINFAGVYKTFSYKEDKQNHRIVFYLKQPLKPIEFALLREMLKTVFPEADKACFNINRMFFGGRDGLILSEDIRPLNTANLYFAYLNELDKMTKQARYRKLNAIAKDVGLKVINGMLDIDVTEDEIYPNFTNPDSFSFATAGNYDVERESKIIAIETATNYQDRLHGKCQLFTDLVDNHVEYDLRRILINNLKYFKGGLGYMKDCIKNNLDKYSKPFYHYDKQVEAYAKGSKFHDSCKRCPYNIDGTCDLASYGNIYNYLKNGQLNKPEFIPIDQRTTVIKSGSELLNLTDPNQWNYYPAQVLEDDLQRVFPKILDEVIRNIDTGVTTGAIYLKAPTGLGKTEALLSYLTANWDKLQGYKIAIAFETYKLMQEVAGRLKVMGIAVPTKPERLPLTGSVEESYKQFLALGMNKKANEIYFAELGSHKDEKPEYMEYLIQLNECYNSQIVFTTHADAIFTSRESYDFVVFDEEVKLHTTGTANIGSLLRALEGVRGDRAEQLRQFLTSETDTEISFFDEYVNKEYSQHVEQNIIAGNINTVSIVHALSANVYMKDGIDGVMWGTKHNLPNAISLIMSATLSEELLKATNKGNTLHFHDTGRVADGGQLIQIADHSFSKNNIKKNLDERVEYVNTQLKEREVNPEDVVVLSYKENPINTELNNAGYTIYPDLYHFNSAGSDKLKGKDLVVIGTPFLNSKDYVMMASLMFGFAISSKENMSVYEKYSINNLKLRFSSFDNDFIRLVQCWHIESQLVQLVGRARLNRFENAKVYLFSKYPLLESNEYWCNGEDVLEA